MLQNNIMFAILTVVLLSLTQSIVSSQLLIESVGRNVRPCEVICDDTYGTKDTMVPDVSFCKRGCRLLSIIDFINDDGTLEQSRNTCVQSCSDAYSGLDNSSACAFGCESQLPSAEMRRQQMSSLLNDEPDFLYPLTRMQQHLDRMMNCIHDQVSRRVVYQQWSVYSQDSAEGARVIIFSSGSNIGTNDNVDTSNMNIYAAGAVDGTMLDGRPPEKRDDSSWLSSLARRTSMSKQSVLLLLCFTAIILIWFCVGLATPLRQHNEIKTKTQKLSIYGDLDYLYDIDDKAMLAYLSPQEPNKMAPPLPIKIQIQQI